MKPLFYSRHFLYIKQLKDLFLIIKVDGLGDANKLYLTLHEMNSLLLENCKTGQKAGGFYRMKNKEQGREKLKMSD